MNKILILALLVLQACASPATTQYLRLKDYPEADKHLVDKCNSVITYWADEGSDEWEDHMVQCVHLDPDYLVEVAPEGEE